MSWFVAQMSRLVWQRPKLWQSHIVLFVLVLLTLAWGLCGVHRFLFDNSAVGLRWVADVVATLVHVVRTLVSVPVFVHGVKKDENTQGRCRHDADHHPRRAAGLPEDLRRPRVAPGGIGCMGEGHTITNSDLSSLSVTLSRYKYNWIYSCDAFFPVCVEPHDSLLLSGSKYTMP